MLIVVNASTPLNSAAQLQASLATHRFGPLCEPNLNEVLNQQSIHCCDFSSFLVVCYVLYICDIKNYFYSL